MNRNEVTATRMNRNEVTRYRCVPKIAGPEKKNRKWIEMNRQRIAWIENEEQNGFVLHYAIVRKTLCFTVANFWPCVWKNKILSFAIKPERKSNSNCGRRAAGRAAAKRKWRTKCAKAKMKNKTVLFFIFVLACKTITFHVKNCQPLYKTITFCKKLERKSSKIPEPTAGQPARTDIYQENSPR